MNGEPRDEVTRWLPVARWELLTLLGLLVLGSLLRLRVCWDWVFAGSDTYGYLALADELHAHGRLAMGADGDLAWWRPPLYAIFLAAVKQGAAAPASYPMALGWKRVEAVQAFLDVFGTGLLLWAMTRRLAGRVAGLVAHALWMVFPVTLVFVAAVLTESLAMCLTVTAVAPLLLLPSRPRLALLLFGAAVGLSLLLRTDGILLAVAGVPFVLAQQTWRRRFQGGALAFGAFLLVIAPWAVRNQVHFGTPHLLGSHLDRYSRPVRHHEGFWRWLRSWAPSWQPLSYPQSCFYDLRCPFSIAAAGLERLHAFSDFDDRADVQRLAEQRMTEGLSESVSQGFATLAEHRRAHAPVKVMLLYPLSRSFRMWFAPHDEILAARQWRPWPQVTAWLLPLFPHLVALLLLATVAGGLAMLRNRPQRMSALILLLPVLTRTFVLPYFGYAMPRYAVEAMVLCIVVCAAGNAQWSFRFRSRSPIASPKR